MPRPELYRTLVSAVEAVSPPPGSGLVVTEVDLDLPVEIGAGVARDGRPVIVGSVPHTRWVAGLLPVVQMARLRIALLDEPPATPSARRSGDG